MTVADDELLLLAEQIAYYRERAHEYDNWWDRVAQYELPEELMVRWREEVAAVESWIASMAPLGRVVELAAGTGIMTRRLAAPGVSTSVVAVDASPEVLALNAARELGPHVRYVEHDVFTWAGDGDGRGEGGFDTVFFSFWLSHVPPARVEEFWSLVGRLLRPGGRAVFLDNVWGDTLRRQDGVRPSTHVETRTDLSSGSTYRVVKVYYEPEELASLLAGLGWDAEVFGTGSFFLGGVARPRLLGR